MTTIRSLTARPLALPLSDGQVLGALELGFDLGEVPLHARCCVGGLASRRHAGIGATRPLVAGVASGGAGVPAATGPARSLLGHWSTSWLLVAVSRALTSWSFRMLCQPRTPPCLAIWVKSLSE